MSRRDENVKILLIGDSGVGKTCFLTRYTQDKFLSTFISTIGIDFKVKFFYFADYRIKVQMWDTAGQERFRAATISYFRGAHGMLLLFDLTDRQTFTNLTNWLAEVQTYCNHDAPVVLIGTKCDLTEERAVSLGEILAFCGQFGLPYFEISSKTDLNIEQPVPHLVASLLNEAKLNQSYVSSAVLEESQSRLMKRFAFFGLTPNLQTTIRRMKVSRPGIESISDSFLCVGWRGENFDGHEPACLFELQQSDDLQKWTSVILTPRLLFLIPKAMNQIYFRLRVTLRNSTGPVLGEWSEFSEPSVRFNPDSSGTLPQITSDVPTPNSQWRSHWTPDLLCSKCERCLIEFSFFRWKHHCRQCGKCLCYNCCPGSLKLFVPLYNAEVKVCEACQANHQRNERIKSANCLPVPIGPSVVPADIFRYLMSTAPGLNIDSDNTPLLTEGSTSLIFRGAFKGIPVAIKLYKSTYLSLKVRDTIPRMGTPYLPTERDLAMEQFIYQQTAECPHSVNLFISKVTGNVRYPFIATQLIDQFGTLSKILPDHQFKLPWIWRLTALSQTASFLQFLHSSGYVHGDINSTNLLVKSMDPTTNDAIRVFDFGCSDRFGEKTLAEVGNLCQTPTHTPPEVIGFILGDNSQRTFHLNGSVDVYGFGILMSEMAMRELAYPDEEAVAQRGGLENFTLQGGRPIVWQTGDLSMPEGYEELTRRCWHQDPSQRPSPNEIIRTLRVIKAPIRVSKNIEIIDLPPPDASQSNFVETKECDEWIQSPVPATADTPLHIVVLEPFEFKKSTFTRTSTARKYEKSISGLRAFSVNDSILSDFFFKGPGGHVEIRTIYKRHPGNLRKYLPIQEYAEEMLKEKEEEFLGIMRDLGAKMIKVTSHEQNGNGTKLKAGISAGQFGGMGVGGAQEKQNDWSRDRSCHYENPSGSLPRFDEKRLFVFYPHEPEWIGIKESRLSSSPIISTTVTFTISSQDFNIGLIEAQVASVGGLSLNYDHRVRKQMSKTYSIDFFTSLEYQANNHRVISTWSTKDVLAFLERIQLHKYLKSFAENGMTGNDLLTRQEKFSEMKMTNEEISKLIRNLDTRGLDSLSRSE